ncbi:Calpain-10 [Liparis tanakae]|uniref:Eukaryotic translation initiation factor 4E type 2 n=1 Tax=Liparis tanakae TaxID=230148 RepID=A0A4Z2HS23_9TELE|nr:Calpain-10 [Liparis tanakae]
MTEAGGAAGGGEALFEDQDFPSDDTSLFSDGSTPIARLQGEITWRRPQVFPPEQPQWGDGGYRGSFHFSFWQQGHWTEVTIDDRLPCINSTLCFSRCHSPTAFWVAMLEKAYAKLHGSYERLWAGQVSEALVDFTGGLAERWSLGEAKEEQRPEQDSDQVRGRSLDLNLLYPVKDECAVSCSTHSNPAGASELGQYHALTVMEWLDVQMVSGGKVLLLRIRNPWGRCCWGGAWIGSGSGWRSVDPVSALDLQARVAEGEFWLDETEFLSQFDDVTVGYPISDEGHLKSIYTGNLLTHSRQLAGRWARGHSAGGSRNSSSYGSNPKLWLKVCERGEVLVSLLQHRTWRNPERSTQTALEDGRNATHQRYQAIALHMWKVAKRRFRFSRMLNKPPCASSRCHSYEREVVLREQLEPGYYLLIPSTYQAGAEARFLIRAFSSSSISLSALKSPAPPLPLTTDAEWESSYFRGSWVEGRTAGGSRNFLSHWQNPCFPFTDVSLACRLTPGDYTIVPSTYQPDRSADFTLSLDLRRHSLKDDDSGDHDQDQGSPKDGEKENMDDEDRELNFSKRKMVMPGPGEHPLQYNYTVWYSRRTPGRPASTQSYEQNIKPIGSFASVEQFWRFYSHMIRPGDLTGHSDFHLFKEGIKPMWEDDANRMGGKWIIRLRKGLASRCWENLILAMLGEQFMVGEEICGAVVSVRFQEDIISIWNKTASDQATTARIRDTLRRVLNLPPNTIMEYKTHTDSIKYVCLIV